MTMMYDIPLLLLTQLTLKCTSILASSAKSASSYPYNELHTVQCSKQSLYIGSVKIHLELPSPHKHFASNEFTEAVGREVNIELNDPHCTILSTSQTVEHSRLKSSGTNALSDALALILLFHRDMNQQFHKCVLTPAGPSSGKP